jgi:hypothetical protein
VTTLFLGFDWLDLGLLGISWPMSVLAWLDLLEPSSHLSHLSQRTTRLLLILA